MTEVKKRFINRKSILASAFPSNVVNDSQLWPQAEILRLKTRHSLKPLV
jgi:hypothetical protein